MIDFTVIDAQTGQVLRSGEASGLQALIQAGEGEDLVLGARASEHEYYDNGQFHARPEAPSAFARWDPRIRTWQEDVQAARVDATERINEACRRAIVSGFTSSALGAPHRYDSEEVDQINLIGAAATGTDIAYRCADLGGVKDFRLHTAAQMAQVLADGAQVKLGLLQRAADRKAAIRSAETVAEILQINWSQP